MHGLACYSYSVIRSWCVGTNAQGGCHALALSDGHYFARGGYFAFCPGESRSRDNVLSRIQSSRASRNPDCRRLRHRSCNGQQLVCALASILQRLATLMARRPERCSPVKYRKFAETFSPALWKVQ